MISRATLGQGLLSVAAIGLAAHFVGAPRDALAQSCNRTCPAAQRDEHGCCPAAPASGGGRKAATGTQNVATSAGPRCPEAMVLVPGGTFWMGSQPGDGDPSESPQHQVTLAPYCIGKTEVTVAQYQACAATGSCPPAPTTITNINATGGKDASIASPFCNAGRAGRDKHPINCVDWTMADGYCRWSGGRLPTEAEWELAAKGLDGRRFPWGSQPPGPKLLNTCGAECKSMRERLGKPITQVLFEGDDGAEDTAPVGSYPAGASPFGALDMAGNVQEWVADWYGDYDEKPQSNPTGPAGGGQRATRGSPWSTVNPTFVRTTDRSIRAAPTYRSEVFGFRCAKSIAH
jgi:formylglycine-generating enzyme required for sulfatase activity